MEIVDGKRVDRLVGSEQSLGKLWQTIARRTDRLYSAAEVFVDKEKQQGFFDLVLEELTREAFEGVKFEMGPIKDPVRVHEKAIDDYSDRFSDDVLPEANVVDVIRARGTVQRNDVLLKMLESFQADPRGKEFKIKDKVVYLQCVRCKNKFRDVDPTHFRNCLLNFRLIKLGEGGGISVEGKLEGVKNDVVFAEIQLHNSEILKLNEGMHAHTPYEYFRSLLKSAYEAGLNAMLERMLVFLSEVQGVPVLLSMLVLIFATRDPSQDIGLKQIPQTRQQLYEFAIRGVLTRRFSDPSQTDKIDTAMAMLKLVAAENMENNRRHFDSDNVEQALLNTPGGNELLGMWHMLQEHEGEQKLPLVKILTDGGTRDSGTKSEYQFKHLSFQEGLMADCLNDEEYLERRRRKCLRDHGPQPALLNNAFLRNTFTIGSESVGRAMAFKKPEWTFVGAELTENGWMALHNLLHGTVGDVPELTGLRLGGWPGIIDSTVSPTTSRFAGAPETHLPDCIAGLCSLIHLTIEQPALEFFDWENPRLHRMIQTLANVQRLDLSRCPKLRRLNKHIHLMRSLETIVLQNCSLLEALPEDFSKLTALVELDLSGCKRLEQLPKGKLASLKILNLEGCKHALTCTPLDTLISSAKLQELTVRSMGLGDPEASHLAKVVLHCTALRMLDARNNELIRDADSLAENVLANESLKHLHPLVARVSKVNDRGDPHERAALPSPVRFAELRQDKLLQLDLGGLAINGMDAYVLVRLLPGARSLVTLRTQRCAAVNEPDVVTKLSEAVYKCWSTQGYALKEFGPIRFDAKNLDLSRTEFVEHMNAVELNVLCKHLRSREHGDNLLSLSVVECPLLKDARNREDLEQAVLTSWKARSELITFGPLHLRQPTVNLRNCLLKPWEAPVLLEMVNDTKSSELRKLDVDTTSCSHYDRYDNGASNPLAKAVLKNWTEGGGLTHFGCIELSATNLDLSQAVGEVLCEAEARVLVELVRTSKALQSLFIGNKMPPKQHLMLVDAVAFKPIATNVAEPVATLASEPTADPAAADGSATGMRVFDRLKLQEEVLDLRDVMLAPLEVGVLERLLMDKSTVLAELVPMPRSQDAARLAEAVAARAGAVAESGRRRLRLGSIEVSEGKCVLHSRTPAQPALLPSSHSSSADLDLKPAVLPTDVGKSLTIRTIGQVEVNGQTIGQVELNGQLRDVVWPDEESAKHARNLQGTRLEISRVEKRKMHVHEHGKDRETAITVPTLDMSELEAETLIHLITSRRLDEAVNVHDATVFGLSPASAQHVSTLAERLARASYDCLQKFGRIPCSRSEAPYPVLLNLENKDLCAIEALVLAELLNKQSKEGRLKHLNVGGNVRLAGKVAKVLADAVLNASEKYGFETFGCIGLKPISGVGDEMSDILFSGIQRLKPRADKTEHEQSRRMAFRHFVGKPLGEAESLVIARLLPKNAEIKWISFGRNKLIKGECALKLAEAVSKAPALVRFGNVLLKERPRKINWWSKTRRRLYQEAPPGSLPGREPPRKITGNEDPSALKQLDYLESLVVAVQAIPQAGPPRDWARVPGQQWAQKKSIIDLTHLEITLTEVHVIRMLLKAGSKEDARYNPSKLLLGKVIYDMSTADKKYPREAVYTLTDLAETVLEIKEAKSEPSTFGGLELDKLPLDSCDDEWRPRSGVALGEVEAFILAQHLSWGLEKKLDEKYKTDPDANAARRRTMLVDLSEAHGDLGHAGETVLRNAARRLGITLKLPGGREPTHDGWTLEDTVEEVAADLDDGDDEDDDKDDEGGSVEGPPNAAAPSSAEA